MAFPYLESAIRAESQGQPMHLVFFVCCPSGAASPDLHLLSDQTTEGVAMMYEFGGRVFALVVIHDDAGLLVSLSDMGAGEEVGADCLGCPECEPRGLYSGAPPARRGQVCVLKCRAAELVVRLSSPPAVLPPWTHCSRCSKARCFRGWQFSHH